VAAADSAPLLTILGAGTLVPDARRHSAAHHLRLPSGAGVLLDCGPGTLHGFSRFGVRWDQLTHVAVSHVHTDHVGDLPALLFAFRHGLPAPREEPLTLLGPPGFGAFLERLAGTMGDHVLAPGCPLRVVEMSPDAAFEDERTEFVLTCCRTPHTAESLAYRVDGPWGSVGYTGDTGPSAEVARFLAGCQALVAECTLPDRAAVPTHLSPSASVMGARSWRPRTDSGSRWAQADRPWTQPQGRYRLRSPGSGSASGRSSLVAERRTC
jgi:ribonuclease BN (tRNA processing enzyme)